MDPSMFGWIGGIVGSGIGVLGGVFGTYCSLKATKPGPERRLMIRWSVAMWIGVTAFVAAMLLLPNPYRWLMWIPYAPSLMWAINRCNRDLARVRAESSPPATKSISTL